MSTSRTSKTLFLSQRDFGDFQDILRDIKKSVQCELAIGGSLAQRVLLPAFGKAIAKQPLVDIDLVLLGGSYENCPLSHSIKKYFYVMTIKRSHASYYFGLIHKSSRKWVDLFSLPYASCFIPITVGEATYPATTIESQILYLAHDLLTRVKNNTEVRKKWLDKYEFLRAQPNVNSAILENEFVAHKNYFLSALPQYALLSITQYLRAACDLAASQAALSRRNWLSRLILSYKNVLVRTTNGIKVDLWGVFYFATCRKLYRFLAKRISRNSRDK